MAPQQNELISLPVKPATVIACFAAATIVALHAWRYIKTKSWYFHAILTATLLELISFIARTTWAFQPTNASAFLVCYFCSVLAPSFVGLACYQTYSRLVWWMTPIDKRNVRNLWCHATFVTPIFFSFDIVCLLIQLGGVGEVARGYGIFWAPNNKADTNAIIKLGTFLLLAGTVLQGICFVAFSIVAIKYVFLSRRWVTSHSEPWQGLAWVISITVTLLSMRSLYRVFDFAALLINHRSFTNEEWPFWLCDLFPVVVGILLLAAIHPGKILPSDYLQVRLDRKALPRSGSVDSNMSGSTLAESRNNSGMAETGCANSYAPPMAMMGFDMRSGPPKYTATEN